MGLKKWTLQDAKNHFGELVECALNDGPQVITNNGEHAVVIISFSAYQDLIKPQQDLVSFFKNSPLCGENLDLERRKDFPREIDF